MTHNINDHCCTRGPKNMRILSVMIIRKFIVNIWYTLWYTTPIQNEILFNSTLIYTDHRHILWIPQSGRPTPLGPGDIKVKDSDYQHTHTEMCVSAWRTCLRKCLGFIYYWTHPFALKDEYFAGPHKSFICGAMHGTQKFQQAWINQVAVMFGTRDRLFYLFCGARALFLTRVFQNFAAHMCTCYSSIV